MKVIKIFLASSIVEFENERNSFEVFMQRRAREFRAKYSLDIDVLRCEEFEDAYSLERAQEKFNRAICESDMVVFLFFRKAGTYTIEEFNVARKAFEASENGKPKIYTYFKVVNDGQPEDSVIEFMQELDKVANHFYQFFEHIDTVNLKMLLNIIEQNLNFEAVSFEDGKCVYNGEVLSEIKTENVSEFLNNRRLGSLREEYERLDKEYISLKAAYDIDTSQGELAEKFVEAATKRRLVREQIDELEKSIFDVTLKMCKSANHGEITERIRQSYRLFEQGDLEGALRILDEEEIDDEFALTEKSLEEMEKCIEKMQKSLEEKKIKGAVNFINEHSVAIEILSAMHDNSSRFAQIERKYRKIVPVAIKYNVMHKTVLDFAAFLDGQLSSEAEEYYLKFISLQENEAEKNAGLLIDAYNMIASYYYYGYKESAAEKYLNRALQYAGTLSDGELLSNAVSVAGTHILFADINSYNADAAVESLKSALNLLEKCEGDRCILLMSDCYEKLSRQYFNGCNMKKAVEYIDKAIAVLDGLSDEGLKKHTGTYVNKLAQKADYNKDKVLLEECIKTAEELYCENPKGYAPVLSRYYDLYCGICSSLEMDEKYEQYLRKARQLIDITADNVQFRIKSRKISNKLRRAEDLRKRKCYAQNEELLREIIAELENYENSCGVDEIRRSATGALADALIHGKSPQAAEPFFNEAWQIYQKHKEMFGVAFLGSIRIYRTGVELYMSTNRRDCACRLLDLWEEDLLKLREHISDTGADLTIYLEKCCNFYIACIKACENERAVKSIERLLNMISTENVELCDNEKMLLANLTLISARCAFSLNDFDGCISRMDKGIDMIKACSKYYTRSSDYFLALALGKAGDICMNYRRFQEAEKYYSQALVLFKEQNEEEPAEYASSMLKNIRR